MNPLLSPSLVIWPWPLEIIAIILRHGPEVPKFVFMSVCFETHGHAQSIPQLITFL